MMDWQGSQGRARETRKARRRSQEEQPGKNQKEGWGGTRRKAGIECDGQTGKPGKNQKKGQETQGP